MVEQLKREERLFDYYVTFFSTSKSKHCGVDQCLTTSNDQGPTISEYYTAPNTLFSKLISQEQGKWSALLNSEWNERRFLGFLQY